MEYLTSQGKAAKDASQDTIAHLIGQTKDSWYESSDYVNKQSGHMRDWAWDTWSDSQLVAFAEKHGVDGKCKSRYSDQSTNLDLH